MQTAGRYKNTLRNRLVTWSTAILTYLPVLAFHTIIISSTPNMYVQNFAVLCEPCSHKKIIMCTAVRFCPPQNGVYSFRAQTE